MSAGSKKSMSDLIVPCFELTAKFQLKAQCTGPAGVANLFTLSSQVLVAAWSVLAIASLQELGRFGVWFASDLPSLVGRLVKLTVSLSAKTECAINESLSEMRSIPKDSRSPSELAGIEAILLTGDLYVTLLQQATLETVLAAMQQGLWISGRDAGAGNAIHGFQHERASLIALGQQVIDLELCVEAFRESGSSQARSSDI